MLGDKFHFNVLRKLSEFPIIKYVLCTQVSEIMNLVQKADFADVSGSNTYGWSECLASSCFLQRRKSGRNFDREQKC